MKLLLDTHVFLWWVADSPRLTAKAIAAIEDGANEIHLSAISGLEIAIKSALGKLDLPSPAPAFVTDQMARNAFLHLPVEMRHTLAVADLPPIHRDPFDRVLVAQARAEKLAIVTGDAEIGRYDVKVVW
jgi:PIN domain nuclease of toxin-antitoxin system